MIYVVIGALILIFFLAVVQTVGFARQTKETPPSKLQSGLYVGFMALMFTILGSLIFDFPLHVFIIIGVWLGLSAMMIPKVPTYRNVSLFTLASLALAGLGLFVMTLF